MAFGRLFGKRRGVNDTDEDLAEVAAEHTADDSEDPATSSGSTSAKQKSASTSAKQKSASTSAKQKSARADTKAKASSESESGEERDWDELDGRDWRDSGPWDLSEIDSGELDEPDPLRIDLGSIIITGFEGMELRLQVAEDTQQVVSVLMVKEDSALEVSAFAAPRSGGLWAELREEIIEATDAAGGTVAQVVGPYGTELRRLLPMVTPEGEQGYQPSRMWVAQGPRWCLRGVLYGQAAVIEGEEEPVASLLDSFRKIIVRRGHDAMAPGDLLPIKLPEGIGQGG